MTRLYKLNILPVFADEAIYIRWAQMIADDPQMHFFLPMFDGKTPMQMWLLSFFIRLNRAEPVVTSRLLSVIAGFITVGLLVLITKRLGGGRLAQITATLLYIFLPFTFFHDRMALTDTLYMMFLALTFWSLLQLKKTLTWPGVVVAGLAFGGALLTKLPGLLFIAQFLLILWLMPPALNKAEQKKAALYFGIAALIGLAMLYSLRVSELFPFLFQRGSDFTFTPKEIIGGEWRYAWVNLKRFIRWEAWYATIGLWLLVATPLLMKRTRKLPQIKIIIALLIMALMSAAYFMVFGRIVFSRYYLPTVIFLIPAAALAVALLWQFKYKAVMAIGALIILLQSLWFIVPWYTDINRVKFEAEDKKQYLTEWSAGFGNKEVADFLKKEVLSQPLSLATEGFFGTLPDGISIYFDHSPLNNKVEIFGVGQPIAGIGDSIKERLASKPVYLVVNEHRLMFDTSECCTQIARYERPYNGPALLLFKVKPTNE